MRGEGLHGEVRSTGARPEGARAGGAGQHEAALLAHAPVHVLEAGAPDPPGTIESRGPTVSSRACRCQMAITLTMVPIPAKSVGLRVSNTARSSAATDAIIRSIRRGRGFLPDFRTDAAIAP